MHKLLLINRSIAPPFKAGIGKQPTPPSSKFGKFYFLVYKISQILRRDKWAIIFPHPEGRGY